MFKGKIVIILIIIGLVIGFIKIDFFNGDFNNRDVKINEKIEGNLFKHNQVLNSIKSPEIYGKFAWEGWIDTFPNETKIESKNNLKISNGDVRFDTNDFLITTTADFDAGIKNNTVTLTNNLSIPGGEFRIVANNTIFSEGFEGTDEQDLDVYDSSWTVTKSGVATAKIDTDEKNSGSASVRFYATGDPVIAKGDRNLGSYSTITIYGRADGPASPILQVWTKNGNNLISSINFWSNYDIQYWQSGSLIDTGYNYQYQVWYKIKIVLDFARQKYDIYINGSGFNNLLIIDDADFETAMTSATGIRIGNMDAWAGGSSYTWYDDLLAESYQTSATWQSANQTMLTNHKLNNTLLKFSGLSSGISEIDRVEWLVDNNVKATYETDIENNGLSPLLITNADLTSGSFNNINSNFTIKIYLTCDGSSTPVIQEIGGTTIGIKGNLTSVPITVPTNKVWDILNINKTEIGNSYINISVLDASTNQPIPPYENLTGTNINVTSINPHLYNPIKLQATFESNGTATAILHDWSVNWTPNTPPKVIELLASNNSVYRTNTTYIYVNVSDLEDAINLLVLDIFYKSSQDSDWQDLYLNDLHFEDNFWLINFTPDKNAVLGFYSFNISCRDLYNELDFKVFTDIVEVLNNPPTKPDVIIIPAMPKTQDDLTVIVTNVTDIEDEPINYFYEWYKNNELQSDLTTELVPSSYVSPTEIWKCVVTPNDGNENGTPGEAVVLIQNSEPEINHSLMVVTFDEDTIDYSINLFYTFKDADYDELSFEYSGNDKLDVNIFSNGTVKLIPETNWFGTETITFFANDSISEIDDLAVINVMPTNDAPVLINIQSELKTYWPSELIEITAYEDQWLNLTIEAIDIDGDLITIETNRTDNIGRDDLNNIFVINNIISFLPTNDDVGVLFINISISDNNGSKIYQDIEIEIENTNNPPSVWIIYPTEGLEFSTEAKINFSCEWYDIDFDVPEPSELLTFIWYSNLSQVSLGNSDFLENITLEAGYHKITIEVEDREGAIANDTVNIIVIAPPPEDLLGKNTKSENLWWVILIIIIVIIIALITIFIFYKRKKQSEEASKAAAAAEAGVLIPDIIPAAGEPLPAAPTVPIALQIQPSVTPTPAVQAAVQIAVLQPRLAGVQPTVTPKLPPAVTEEKEEPSKEQKLAQLDEQLLKGEISQQEYEALKQQIETAAPQGPSVPSVISLEPRFETPPTPTPVPILKEPVQPTVVSPAIDTLEPIQEPQVGGIPEQLIITPTPLSTVKEPKEPSTPIITGVTCPQCGSSETITFPDGSFSCSTCGNKWM